MELWRVIRHLNPFKDLDFNNLETVKNLKEDVKRFCEAKMVKDIAGNRLF